MSYEQLEQALKASPYLVAVDMIMCLDKVSDSDIARWSETERAVATGDLARLIAQSPLGRAALDRIRENQDHRTIVCGICGCKPTA